MTMWTTCLVLIFAAGVQFTLADYPCVCNYATEAPIYASTDASSAVVGYIYEFDCLTEYNQSTTSAPGWKAIVNKHKVAYVQQSGSLSTENCHGKPDTVDPTTTTTTTSTTTVPFSTPSSSVAMTTNIAGTTDKSGSTSTENPSAVGGSTQSVTSTNAAIQNSSTYSTLAPNSLSTVSAITTSAPMQTTTATASKTPLPTTRAAATNTPSATPTPKVPSSATITTARATSTTVQPTTSSTKPPTTSTTTKATTTTTTTQKPPTTTSRPTTTRKPSTTTHVPVTHAPVTHAPVVTHSPGSIHFSGLHGCPANVISAAHHNHGYYRMHGGSCYELIPHHYYTWQYAENNCKNKGGHLVHISNRDEENFIWHFLDDHDFDHEVWIGLNDRHHEESFTWSSGDMVVWKNWVPGRKNNFDYHNYEDCVVYVPEGYAHWDDIDCQETHPWICRYDPAPAYGSQTTTLVPVLQFLQQLIGRDVKQ